MINKHKALQYMTQHECMQWLIENERIGGWGDYAKSWDPANCYTIFVNVLCSQTIPDFLLDCKSNHCSHHLSLKLSEWLLCFIHRGILELQNNVLDGAEWTDILLWTSTHFLPDAFSSTHRNTYMYNISDH